MPYYMDAVSYMYGKLVERILDLTDYNYTLYDSGMSKIKDGLLREAIVISIDAKTGISFKIVDDSEDAYIVRNIVIWYRNAAGNRDVCLLHQLAQNYSKPAGKTLTIILRAGHSRI